MIAAAFIAAFALLAAALAVYVTRDPSRRHGPGLAAGPMYEVSYEEYLPVRRLPGCPFPELPPIVPGAGMVAGEMPAQAQVSPRETPAPGDEAPGPDCLPEGDTHTLWPPQEAPGPGNPPPMSDLLANGIRDAEDAQRWPHLVPGAGYSDPPGTFARLMDGA